MRTEQLARVLENARELGVSDLIFAPGHPPLYKLGESVFSTDHWLLELRDLEALVNYFFPAGTMERLVAMARGRERPQEMMTAHSGTFSRYRVQLLWAQPNVSGSLGSLDREEVVAEPVLVFRLIDLEPKPFEVLGLPMALEEVVRKRMGLFLVVGPTDSGKTTTLAAMVERINAEQPRFVMTVEEPIEYVFAPKKAFVVQREVGRHVGEPATAVLTALRSNVSVLVMGEVRNPREIEATLLAAETGHLVLASLHAVSAVDAVERLVLALPPEKRELAFQVLSSVLLGVIAQRLVPVREGRKRVLAYELLLTTPEVRGALKEGNLAALEDLLREGRTPGLVSLERSLAELVRSGRVAFETARAYVHRDADFTALFRGRGG
ncbi:Twitching mobility protein [bacterium HR39]|nr:Twitching mobility protein [bacterium HR39]